MAHKRQEGDISCKQFPHDYYQVVAATCDGGELYVGCLVCVERGRGRGSE